MLTDQQIMKSFGISEIKRKYPRSGQKQVMLVSHNFYDTVILKIVDGEDERVKREIEIMTANDFSNVPCIKEIDSYEVDDQKGIYIIEEFISGHTLRELLTGRKLPLNDVMNLAESMLTVLLQMEKSRVVHRDIKPENIIKCDDGDWYLIDFGIARGLDMSSLTLTEVKMGPHTPGYGAPELFQYSKSEIDSRADLFSLGVVLFESATGKHPFIKGNELSVNEIWYNTITVLPEMVKIDNDKDEQFMGLIQTFMQKHISRRPRSAEKAWEWFISVKEHLQGGDD